MKRFRKDKRGISNVVVVMLSLILIVIIVGNVILWSYQMSQLDLERMQETISIADATRATRSSWFTAQSEFAIAVGSRLSGTYTDTKNMDNYHETFGEERTQVFNPSNYALTGFTKYVSGSVSNLNSNDGTYMNFRSYPNYELRYQEDLATSSTVSTAYQDKVSVVFTPQTTADFVIIAAAEVQGSNTNYQAKARLTINSTTYQELAYRVKDTTDWYPFSALKRLTLSEGASYLIKIQFCTNNAGGTAYVRNARLVMFNLQSAYAESEGLSTTDLTSWQDKATLTFTPPTNGDYLIIATANYRGSATNRDVRIRLIQDNTTVHTEILGRPGSGTTENYYTFGVMRKVSLNAASHNFTLQYCPSSNPGIAGVNYAHIVAIRISQFDSYSYAEDETESAPAAINTWYDKVTNTYAATSGDYLLLGSISYKSGSTTDSVGVDFQTESTSKQSLLAEHSDATSYDSAFFMTTQALTAGNKADRIRYMGESTSARVKNVRLISCKLPTATQTVEVEFSGSSNTDAWMQLDWTVDSSFTSTAVTATFQLYNYQSSQYPTSGDGYMTDVIGTTDVAKNQAIASNPAAYRDANGNWKMKITGVKGTTAQFELKADWVEYKIMTSDIYQLDINNSFAIDLSEYPLDYVHGFEMLVRYNVTANAEKWFLKAFNWNTSTFSDAGFNNTGGNQPFLNDWTDYATNVTGNWRDYVKDDGTLLVEFLDEGLNATRSLVEIDFFGVRAVTDGTSLQLENSGPSTIHIVALWIVNSTNHQRYDTNLFINSGEEATYLRVDISIPQGDFIAKVATERGNIAVFRGE